MPSITAVAICRYREYTFGIRAKMDDLRRLFEAIGFSNVETFIASGNVLFDSPSRSTPALGRKIADHLEKALGYEVTTLVRSMSELADIARYKPFPDAELNAAGHALYIAFTADSPSDKTKQRLLSLATKVDDFHVYGREVYWLCRKKISESEVPGILFAKTLGMPATLRNSTTVRKIASKYQCR